MHTCMHKQTLRILGLLEALTNAYCLALGLRTNSTAWMMAPTDCISHTHALSVYFVLTEMVLLAPTVNASL